MRQAAYHAEMASDDQPEQLLIALEPEAASIYCRKLRLHQLMPERPNRFSLSPRRKNESLTRKLNESCNGDDDVPVIPETEGCYQL